MRQWPAVLALAAVLTACQEQSPTAVPEIGPVYEGQAIPATEFTVPVDFQGVDMCGVDIADATGTFHRVRRRASDPETGLTHFVRVDHYRLVFVGRITGWEWLWNETIVQADQYGAGEGPEAWTIVDHATAAGVGDAPNFDISIQVHLTVNASGEVTADFARADVFCDD